MSINSSFAPPVVPDISYHPNFIRYMNGEITDIPKERYIYNDKNETITTMTFCSPPRESVRHHNEALVAVNRITAEHQPKQRKLNQHQLPQQQPQQTQQQEVIMQKKKNLPVMIHRNTLAGTWVLDKSRNNEWSMKHCLEVMNIHPTIIDAHCKGESKHISVLSIEFNNNDNKVRIKQKNFNKRNDIVMEVPLNAEQIEYLPPGNRKKCLVATVDDTNCKLRIESNIQTLNGYITMLDTTSLTQENTMDGNDNENHNTNNKETKSVLIQEIVVTNHQTNKNHKTIRYFNPIDVEIKYKT